MTRSREARLTPLYIFGHADIIGGGEESGIALVGALDLGRFAPVAVLPADGEVKARLDARGVRTVVSSLPSLRRPLAALGAVVRLARLGRESGADVLHAATSRAALYAGLAGLMTRTPVIWHVRESKPDLRWYDALLLLLSKRVVCVSDSVRRIRFARLERLARERCVTILNGVDTDVFAPGESLRRERRKRLGISDETLLIVMLGNFISRKGQAFFLKSLRHIAADLPPFQVVMAGRHIDESVSAEVKKLAREPEFQGRVVVSAPDEDVPSLLAAADLFALTSKSEGLSRALMEAMSVGLPVVATDIPETREALGADGAFFAAYGDEAGLGAAVRTLLTDAALRRRMGEANRARAVENFAIATHAERIGALYEDVAGGRPSPAVGVEGRRSSRKPRSGLLVDGREFAPDAGTGIGRVLEGIVQALARAELCDMTLAVRPGSAPESLTSLSGVRIHELPAGRLAAELALPRLARRHAVYLSPYPKLPPFMRGVVAVNIVHDVLNITHSKYKRSLHARYALARLYHGLLRADMTWYDSRASLDEAQRLTGRTGRDARVRHLGIGRMFTPEAHPADAEWLKKLGLEAGYVLVLGNGKPHKNLGVLLEAGFSRPLVVVGCSAERQAWWQARHPDSGAVWAAHVPGAALPAVLRGAFCLVQPSLAEGYGFPPLEAMACGTPAIVSAIPVLEETSGGAAQAVSPDDPAAWRQAVERLEDADVYERQRKRGLTRAHSLRGDAGWQGHVADIRELLEAKKRGDST